MEKTKSYVKSFSRKRINGFIQDYADAFVFNITDLANKGRIVDNVLYITGVPGSGKTELAEDISADLKIPVVNLDSIDEGDYMGMPRQLALDFLEWSQNVDPIEGKESYNFLRFLQNYQPDPIIVEGRQIYECGYVNPKEQSVIVLMTPKETVIKNRVLRDNVTEAFALKETEVAIRSLERWLKTKF